MVRQVLRDLRIAWPNWKTVIRRSMPLADMDLPLRSGYAHLVAQGAGKTRAGKRVGRRSNVALLQVPNSRTRISHWHDAALEYEDRLAGPSLGKPEPVCWAVRPSLGRQGVGASAGRPPVRAADLLHDGLQIAYSYSLNTCKAFRLCISSVDSKLRGD